MGYVLSMRCQVLVALTFQGAFGLCGCAAQARIECFYYFNFGGALQERAPFFDNAYWNNLVAK